jgi:hypothetical protein
VDGGNGLQIWRVAMNIFDNQFRIFDKGCSSRLGGGLTTPHRKNRLFTKFYSGPWTWASGRLLWTQQWTSEFHKRRGIWLAEWLSSSQEGVCSMKLDSHVSITCYYFRSFVFSNTFNCRRQILSNEVGRVPKEGFVTYQGTTRLFARGNWRKPRRGSRDRQ